MILSATFDEQILKSLSIEAWLDYCIQQKLQALEFSPDPSVLPMDVYKTLIKKQRAASISTSFHVPYFAKFHDKSAINYDLSYYTKNSTEFKNKYDLLFAYILTSDQESKLTLHGASRDEVDGKLQVEKSRDRTWSAIDYLLNLIEKRKIPLTLAIELSGPESSTYLTKRSELTDTIKQFYGSSLKICWDLTHDYSHQPEIEKPCVDFLNAVDHVHIHGVNDQQEKHLSLEKSSLNFQPMMTLLNDISYSNAVVLEILTHSFANSNNYLKTLTSDLNILTNLIK